LNAETVDAEFTSEESTALAVPSRAVVQWTPSFVTTLDEACERRDLKHEFFKRVMIKDQHYGVIPGTSSKPTLLKPGAELLNSNMGLCPAFSDEHPPIIDVTGEDHNGEPFIRYQRTCRIYRQIGATEHERMIVAQASGSCNSWEPKYRYRNAARKCPQCSAEAIIQGKKEYGGGWICFKKKNGCGAKFRDNDPKITEQETGKVANTEVLEQDNTFLKMADKRALIAATLLATGCSDIFTQDLEDMGHAGDPGSQDIDPEPPPETAPELTPEQELEGMRKFLMRAYPPLRADHTRKELCRKLFAKNGLRELNKQQLHDLKAALEEMKVAS